MDFLDPKKRRLHRIQLFVGYGLMAVALGLFTYLFVLVVAFGYGLDRKGTIIQNGLVFLDAHPQPATIYLNGQNKGTTSSRLTIPAGEYVVQLKRDGYRTWQRGFTLGGADVVQLVYPFLFPTKLVTKDADLFTAAPGLATESPDRHWFVAEQGGSLTNFDQVDLISTDNTTSALSFAADLFTTAPGDHQLAAVEWSTDNRHLLIKHTYNNGANYEFVMLDREQPSQSVNLTKTFADIPMTDVRLHDKRFDQLYVLDNSGTLSTLDTKSKQTTIAASHVVAYKSFAASQLLYATAEGAEPGHVLVKLKDGDSTYSLHNFSGGTTYLLDMTQFSGNTYVVAGAASEGSVYEYKNPVDSFKQTPALAPTPVALLRVSNPQHISFSQNTRFVEVQSGSKFAVYDAETDRQYRYDTKLSLDPLAKAAWMDGHRLILLSGGKTVIFDFDGTNLQDLSAANPGYEVFFNHDYTAMYNVGPSISVKDHSALTRTELVVK